MPWSKNLEVSMDVRPYLNFKGECESAFSFYERALDGTLGPIFRYAGSPLADQVPADWQQKVMHASITIGNQVLMGADVAPERYETPKGFSLSLQLSDTSHAERIFRELSTNAKIIAPLERTFWAARFGALTDRYGITWLINCEEVADSAR
jgi:PhnB protein